MHLLENKRPRRKRRHHGPWHPPRAYRGAYWLNILLFFFLPRAWQPGHP